MKVLIMDDEPQVLNLIGELLECYGYQVVLEMDGASAIKAYKQAKTLGEPFDAVVMDLMVPNGMGGLEAVAYLRDFDPGVKVIISSGYINEPVMADYKRYGFDGVARKPYLVEELMQILDEVVESKVPELECRRTG
ncbi:MAG TPA: response regulator [Bacillota bacterium]|nr:response regulator [Bacillota bacterium]